AQADFATFQRRIHSLRLGRHHHAGMLDADTAPCRPVLSIRIGGRLASARRAARGARRAERIARHP
ncbi:hypothetical protein, partial [Longimicrobium sp.]|uniref:hypothetical protein n=1 Tax=Longimicrobium sp. TaxID=2029185 RepID=UPI002E356BC7